MPGTGETSRPLPRPALQTAMWALLGALASGWVLWDVGLPAPGVHPAVLAVLLVVAAVTTRLDLPSVRPLRRREHDERVSMHEGSLVLFLVVLPPGWAWLLVVGGYALGSAVRARGMKYVFNVGLWATSVALAVAVHEAIAPGPTAGLSGRVVAALATAVLVHLVVDSIAVQLVVAAATGTRLRSYVASTWQVLVRSWVGNLLLGFAAAALWLQSPWLALGALGLVVVLRDAYGQAVDARRVLDRVRLDRDRLDLVTESSSTGVVLLDHDGTITVWNPAVVQLTGITSEEAVERSVDAVLADRVELLDDGTRIEPSLALTTARDLVPGPTTLTLRRADGEDRVVEMMLTRQHDELGGVARVVVQLYDVTTQHEVNRLQDDFLARVTHELRTPLTSIIGVGRTLLHHTDELSTVVRDDLTRRLVGAGESLERLVDDLLLVSATGPHSSGRTTRTLQLQPLGALVDAAVERECSEHPGRSVEVRHAGPASAIVDEGWLGTVVRHLVSNALRYSDDLSPVTVEVEEGPEHALVRVVDRGRGIPPSKLYRVFDRFARVEDPLRMETRGAGLGLFIVDRLVARMGGHVEVDSTLGEGSTFTVALPRTTPDRPPREQPGRAGQLVGRSGARGA